LYFVYILQSDIDNKRYIGYSNNLVNRLNVHNSGLVKSSKNRRPLKLIYFEKYSTKSEALKREWEIKARRGKFTFPQ
jgi:putative endonuclease